MGIKDQKLVVYTCLTGDYEQPVKMHELEENINSVHIELSDEIIDEINAIHENNPSPAP